MIILRHVPGRPGSTPGEALAIDFTPFLDDMRALHLAHVRARRHLWWSWTLILAVLGWGVAGWLWWERMGVTAAAERQIRVAELDLADARRRVACWESADARVWATLEDRVRSDARRAQWVQQCLRWR